MKLCKAVVLLVVLLLAVPVVAVDQIENSSPLTRDRLVTAPANQGNALPTSALDGPPYWDGTIKIYVVEETSSLGWYDHNGSLYDFPFLAFALNTPMTLNDSIWDTTVTWDGSVFGYGSLREDNIAVQAVLFSASDGYPAAAAMAYPGVPGSNYANSDSGTTHTVFVEEGTATW